MMRILLSKISNVERSRIAVSDYSLCKLFPKTLEYDHTEKKSMSLLGHLMCEYLFFDLNIPRYELKTLHQNKYGKWQFKNSQYDFSISHSHERVIVAIADAGRVGVDIEKPRPLRVFPYKDCFTSSEWHEIQNAADNERIFFDYWTKKESLLKAWGFGLQIPLNKVSIENNIGRIVDTEMHGYLSVIDVPDYSCCICNTVEVGKIEVEEFMLKI